MLKYYKVVNSNGDINSVFTSPDNIIEVTESEYQEAIEEKMKGKVNIMMTDYGYLKIKNKRPDPYTNSEFHKHYEGEEYDYNRIIEYNKELCKKYPFLIPKNRWTGLVPDDYDYTYTELDAMPDGWRIAFGMEMMEELRQALLHAQEEDPDGGYEESLITTHFDSDRIIPYLEGFFIIQIKEKYGGLRFYCSSAPKEVFDVISKYEKLSYTICIECGQPAEYEQQGYIAYLCEKCAKKMCKDDIQFQNEFKKIGDA